VSRATRRVEIRVASVDDVQEIHSVARTTWDHTYRESIPESVRKEFVSQAHSADSPSSARVESGESNNQVTAQ
jgi:hypothetical protein